MISLDHLLDRLKLHITASHWLTSSERLMHPVRDWYVILVCFLALVISVLALGAYLYLSFSHSSLDASRDESETRIEAIDRSILRETALFFEGQSAEFEELRKSPPKVSNPL